MKRITIFLNILMIVCSYIMHAQVGIKTNDPEQAFHIDPAGNTLATDPTTKTDDVVITSEGTVGIGTTTPDLSKKLDVVGNIKVLGSTIAKDTIIIAGTASAKRIGVNVPIPEATLHIANSGNNTKFRLADGSQSSGHLLTADQEGRAYWDGLRPMSSIVRGSLMSGVSIPGGTITNITKDSLFLSPGRWLVVAKSAIAGSPIEGFYMYMRLYAEAGFKGDTSGNNVFLTATGSSAEQRTGSAYAATPNLMYIVSVPTKTTTAEPGTKEYNTAFWIELTSSRSSTTSSNYGAMQFYALRIDRQD